MAVEAGEKTRPESEAGADDNGGPQPTPREVTEEEAKRLEAEEARQDAAVEAYARDHDGLTTENEQDALDYLLAPKRPRLYDVRVQYDTESGRVPLTFVIRGMDGRRMDEIEQRHRSETTGKIDVISADCELVATATAFLESHHGRQVRLTSEEFLTLKVPDPNAAEGEEAFVEEKVAAPPIALERRFATQLGLIQGVARAVRIAAGFDPERVGEARRRLVDAVGNS